MLVVGQALPDLHKQKIGKNSVPAGCKNPLIPITQLVIITIRLTQYQQEPYNYNE